MTEFHRLMKEEVFRDVVLEECYAKMMAHTGGGLRVSDTYKQIAA